MANVTPDEKDEFRAPPELTKQAEKHFLPPTPEELAAAQKHQNALLNMLTTGARLTNEERELAVSVRNEGFYRQMVEGGESSAANNLANCLITQGRFEEALELCPARADELNELIDARDRDDYERCDCPTIEIERVPTPSEYIVRKQWHPVKQVFCYLYRCKDCGHMNLAENPIPEIVLYHAARMNAIATAKAEFLNKARR
jgi:hypothetical protein